MISLRPDNTLTAKAALMRLFKVAGMACALTLVVASNVARAEDDGEQQPEMSFEHKMIDGLLRGLGGQTMEDNNKGIEYRERSPLVIPSKLDLPPPASKSAPAVANWPKDPDVQARKEAIEASKRATPDWDASKRPLMPSELAKKPSSKRSATALNDDRPGMDNSNYNLLSPSQLGFKNSMMSDLFGGGVWTRIIHPWMGVMAMLSFLGLGIQAPHASWGNMLTGAQDLVWSAPLLAVWPGLAIFLTVIAFNFLGDALQDALDPRAERR